MGPDDRRPTSRPGHDLLRPFHDQITRWAAAGLTLREIASRLGEAGCPTDHNRVRRYCKAHGIEIGSKPTGRRGRRRETLEPVTQQLPVLRARPPQAGMQTLPVVRKPSWLVRLFGRRPKRPRLLPAPTAIVPHDAPPRTSDAIHGPSTRIFNIALQLIVDRHTPKAPIRIDITPGDDGQATLRIDAGPSTSHGTLDSSTQTDSPPAPRIEDGAKNGTTADTSDPSPRSAGAASCTDEEIERYADVLALFRRMEAAMQTGHLALLERDVDRFHAWMLSEGAKAPAWLRDAAQNVVIRAEEVFRQLSPDGPMPLLDNALGQPHLMIFLAERRYNWAWSKNDPELIRREVDAIIAWLRQGLGQLVDFEAAQVAQIIASLESDVAAGVNADAPNRQEAPAFPSRRAQPAPRAEQDPGPGFDASRDNVPGPAGEGGGDPLFAPLARSSAWVPELTLLEFGTGDRWALQDACEGTLIMGSVGSGKTSGSGRALAETFLAHGFGGMVLCAKPDEAALWESYARAQGRTEQLCVIRPRGPFRFNFLNYLGHLPTDLGGSTEEIVNFFYGLLESFSADQGGVASDAFWEKTGRELVRQLVRLIRASGEPLTLQAIRRALDGAPLDLKSARELLSGDEGALAGQPPSTRYFAGLLRAARERAPGTRESNATLEAITYWTQRFPDLANRTRSIVVTSFTSMIDLFFEPDLQELLCSDTTIVPDDVLDGAILVMDVPVLRSPGIGRILQLVWKYFFQTAVERRDDPDDASRRPVFLWVDEAQYFWSQHDGEFATTSRSLRCANVYLTQNLPNYYALTGGRDAVHRTDGFFACLNTKIFHANNDRTTNDWAAALIGRTWTWRGRLEPRPPRNPPNFWEDLFGEPHSTASAHETETFAVNPAEFSRLRTGALRHRYLVDAYFVKSGTTFCNGKSFFKATFQQKSSF